MMEVTKYEVQHLDAWEHFVKRPQSLNGTFLHSRRFLSYHPENKFTDNSLLIYRKDKLAAVVPACVMFEDGKKIFFSHKGSTFGGIVVSKDNYNIRDMCDIIAALEDYLSKNGFDSVYLKNTSEIFSERNTELIDYLMFYHGYIELKELSLYIDFNLYDRVNPENNFSKLRKRKIKTALNNGLAFRKLYDEELPVFYEILSQNLRKFDVEPVHTLTELVDFKKERLKDIVLFFGCFLEEKLTASAMCFDFYGDCLHTQYLCMDYDYSGFGAMDFLDYNMIQYAMDNGYKRFSFGICTEKNGRVFNQSLAEFKESFGCSYVNNVTFYKNLTRRYHCVNSSVESNSSYTPI